MSIRLLVLHGPNVPLRLEKEASLTLTELHRTLKARAKELGATLRTATVHGEEGLLAALYEQRDWAGGVLVASGHLASSAAVTEALALLGVPHVELSTSVRGRAVPLDAQAYLGGLASLCAQLHDGVDASPKAKGATSTRTQPKADATSSTKVKAATATSMTSSVKAKAGTTASGARAGKTLGRASGTSPAAPSRPVVKKTLGRTQAAEAAPTAAPKKTLGRKAPEQSGTGSSKPSSSAPLRGMPTREAASAQLAAKLSGALDAKALQAWAREGWAKLEAAQSPDSRLSAVLLRLTANANLSDDRLITLMTELDR